MIIDASTGALAVILTMAGVTILLRWLGFYIMAHVRLGPRLEAGFRTLPGAVAAALFTPLVVADGITALAAIIVAAIVTRLGRGEGWALAAAIAAALLLRRAGL
jgi:uncharacterized membrane protein